MEFKHLALTAAFAATAATVVYAAATAIPHADTRALHDYVLSMDKVRHYASAGDALRQAAKSDAALAAEARQMQAQSDQTLADLRAKLQLHPRVLAYYSKQGLSVDDSVLLPLTLIDAAFATAIADPGKYPAEVSADQVSFVKQHRAELDALNLFKSGDE